MCPLTMLHRVFTHRTSKTNATLRKMEATSIPLLRLVLDLKAYCVVKQVTPWQSSKGGIHIMVFILSSGLTLRCHTLGLWVFITQR